MRTIAVVALLAACGSSDTEYPCSTQTQRQDGLECVIARDGLYVDELANCILVYVPTGGESYAADRECLAIDDDAVLIKNSYFMGSKRGVMTQTVEQHSSTPRSCVFRECQ